MTELERMLKDSLLTLEREMSDAQTRQERQLNGQQERLKAQDGDIQELRRAIRQLQTQQQESEQHLRRLSDVYRDLESLLTKLNGLLR